jgi:hypothetical protein
MFKAKSEKGLLEKDLKRSEGRGQGWRKSGTIAKRSWEQVERKRAKGKDHV